MEKEAPLPICSLCAKSGVLCSACEKKLNEEEISALDVEISKLLYELGKGKIGFERAIETENFVIILTKKGEVGKIIGRGGKNIKFLSRKLNKPVRVVGTESLKKMVYDFVYPAEILEIGLVYEEDGSKKHKVRLDKEDKGKLRMEVEEIERIVSSISDREVEISFD